MKKIIGNAENKSCDGESYLGWLFGVVAFNAVCWNEKEENTSFESQCNKNQKEKLLQNKLWKRRRKNNAYLWAWILISRSLCRKWWAYVKFHRKIFIVNIVILAAVMKGDQDDDANDWLTAWFGCAYEVCHTLCMFVFSHGNIKMMFVSLRVKIGIAFVNCEN